MATITSKSKKGKEYNFQSQYIVELSSFKYNITKLVKKQIHLVYDQENSKWIETISKEAQKKTH